MLNLVVVFSSVLLINHFSLTTFAALDDDRWASVYLQ